ncbi:MAG: ABC transporter permease subunit [Candidatus Cloacimonetes bacterium]|nr:ABC transporter permease subunit [Candidatus Cloacimonadota bacterium]
MKYITRSFLSLLFLALMIFGLLLSLNIPARNVLQPEIDWRIMLTDFFYSFIRVTLTALTAWITAIFIGKLLYSCPWLKAITMPALNLIRHISPYAWLPIAIIWFGLGEAPAAAILLTALFFPAVIMTAENYESVLKEYREEAHICGADAWQIFTLVEIPVLKAQFINLLRILWGLGWTTVIAVEMLGVKNGLGFRLLDFRYLLQYENMLIYILIMGCAGIIVDNLLRHCLKIIPD